MMPRCNGALCFQSATNFHTGFWGPDAFEAKPSNMTFSKQAMLMQIPQAGLLKSPAGQHAARKDIFSFWKLWKERKLPKRPQTECRKVGLAPKLWQTESDHQHQCIKIWVELILDAPKLTAAASAWRASGIRLSIKQLENNNTTVQSNTPKAMSVIRWLAKKQEAKFACCCIYSITPSGSGKQHLQCRLWMWVLAAKVRHYSSERLLNYVKIPSGFLIHILAECLLPAHGPTAMPRALCILSRISEATEIHAYCW